MATNKSPALSQTHLTSDAFTPNKNLINESGLLNDTFIESDFGELKDDQKVIEKTLNYLINFNPNDKFRKCRQTNKTNASKISPRADVPDTVSEDLKSLTDINDLHPGVLLDLLKKVNSLNKKLLQNYKHLNEKYLKLENNLKDSLNKPCKNPPAPSLSTLQPYCSTPAPINSNTESNKYFEKINEQLQMKVDSLEQARNENKLLCSGKFIEDLTKTDSNSNFCESVFQKFKSLDDTINKTELRSVYIFGKNRKSVIVECSSNFIKIKLLKLIKSMKPDDVYLSEFVTARRYKLFHRVRNIKKEHPAVIRSVYIRQGNIYYRLHSGSTFRCVKTDNDVSLLEHFVLVNSEELINQENNTLAPQSQ